MVLCVWLSPRLIAIPGDMRPMFYGFIAVLTVAFPGLTMLYFKWSGAISSLQMPERGERITPFFVTLLFYGICYYRMLGLPLDPVLTNMFLGAIIAVGLALLITRKFKISIHMVGIGGLLGAVLGLGIQHGLYGLAPLVYTLIILGGLVGSARLILDAHKPNEVYSGFLLGLVVVFLSVTVI